MLIKDSDDQSYSKSHITYDYLEKKRVQGLLLGGFSYLEISYQTNREIKDH